MLIKQEFAEDDGSGFSSSNKSPKELFLSSDANALVEHTKRVLVIEDDELVHLKVTPVCL